MDDQKRELDKKVATLEQSVQKKQQDIDAVYAEFG